MKTFARNVSWTVAVLLVAPAVLLAADNPVSVTVVPDPVLVVREGDTQQVSLDFLVKNSGQEAVEFVSVLMTAFDSKGALVTRREINAMGMCPSIATLPFKTVDAGKTVIAYNPFQELPAEMELATLKFTITTTPKESEGTFVNEVTVKPVPSVVKTALTLPVKGKVIIWDGWDFYAHHRRLDMCHPLMVSIGVKRNITRYGMDFMQADASGSTFKGKGEQLEDYYIFGKPIVAPAAGTVADVVTDRPDSPIGKMLIDYDELMRTKDLRLLGGNFVVLDHGNGEFSFFAHMKSGSVKVKKGDKVAAGQQLGEVGSSGDSSEPHLHYQLRTSADPDCESLPAEFKNFRRWNGDRSETVKRGTVNTGDVIEGL